MTRDPFASLFPLSYAFFSIFSAQAPPTSTASNQNWVVGRSVHGLSCHSVRGGTENSESILGKDVCNNPATPHPKRSTLPPTNVSISPLLFLDMTSLIDGFFQLGGSNSVTGGQQDLTTSSKSYLLTFDSCASLGSLAKNVFVPCEVRLYPKGQDLEGALIFAHGRFSVVPPTSNDELFLQVEVHHFVVMNLNIDPDSKDIPDELNISLTLLGRVIPTTLEPRPTQDKFFTLEISDYIRDHMKTFRICCRLNRTTSKRWERATVPALGTTVLVSGCLDGDPTAVTADVHTMQFVNPVRGGDGSNVPQTPGRSKFGIPMSRVKGKGRTLPDPPSSPLLIQDSSPLSTQDSSPLSTQGSSPLSIQGKQSPKPLSALPIPSPPNPAETEAGSSHSRRTARQPRVGAKRKEKVAAGTSAEPTTADEDDSPLSKKQKSGLGAA